MLRVVSLILLCASLIPSLTACYDSKEIDNWAYVYTIGVDKGVADKLRFTFQIPTIGGGSGNGGGEQGTQKKQETDLTTISIDAPTFYAGVNMVNTSLSRTLNYMHAKYVIISEDLAREGVGRFMNGMVRSRQIRRIMHIIVVKGKAGEFIKEFKPLVGTAVSKTQEGMMDQEEETGLFDDVNYNDFLNNMKSDKIQPTAVLAAINDFSGYKASGPEPIEFKRTGEYPAGGLPRSGGNNYEFLGTALFDGDKMIGELNGTETRAMLMVRGDFSRGSLVIADPLNKELRISLDAKKQKSPEVKISFQGEKPVIHVKVFLEGDIQNLQGSTEYESQKLKPVLENAFKADFKELIDKTINKCKALNCDVFGFGEKASMQFLTIQEWEDYNWLKHFKGAQVTSEIELTIRRTGTMIKTNPTVASEGKK